MSPPTSHENEPSHRRVTVMPGSCPSEAASSSVSTTSTSITSKELREEMRRDKEFQRKRHQKLESKTSRQTLPFRVPNSLRAPGRPPAPATAPSTAADAAKASMHTTTTTTTNNNNKNEPIMTKTTTTTAPYHLDHQSRSKPPAAVPLQEPSKPTHAQNPKTPRAPTGPTPAAPKRSSQSPGIWASFHQISRHSYKNTFWGLGRVGALVQGLLWVLFANPLARCLWPILVPLILIGLAVARGSFKLQKLSYEMCLYLPWCPVDCGVFMGSGGRPSHADGRAHRTATDNAAMDSSTCYGIPEIHFLVIIDIAEAAAVSFTRNGKLGNKHEHEHHDDDDDDDDDDDGDEKQDKGTIRQALQHLRAHTNSYNHSLQSTQSHLAGLWNTIRASPLSQDGWELWGSAASMLQLHWLIPDLAEHPRTTASKRVREVNSTLFMPTHSRTGLLKDLRAIRSHNSKVKRLKAKVCKEEVQLRDDVNKESASVTKARDRVRNKVRQKEKQRLGGDAREEQEVSEEGSRTSLGDYLADEAAIRAEWARSSSQLATAELSCTILMKFLDQTSELYDAADNEMQQAGIIAAKLESEQLGNKLGWQPSAMDLDSIDQALTTHILTYLYSLGQGFLFQYQACG